jgi:hypothetical protein
MDAALMLLATFGALGWGVAALGWHEVARLEQRLEVLRAISEWRQRGRRVLRLAVAGLFGRG